MDGYEEMAIGGFSPRLDRAHISYYHTHNLFTNVENLHLQPFSMKAGREPYLLHIVLTLTGILFAGCGLLLGPHMNAARFRKINNIDIQQKEEDRKER